MMRPYLLRVAMVQLALAMALALGIAGCAPRLVDPVSETDAFTESFAAWEEIDPYSPFAERLASHRTKLLVRGPSQGSALESPPPGAREVSYESAGLALRGWYAVPSWAEPTAPPLSTTGSGATGMTG